jgi:hypothetical protein
MQNQSQPARLGGKPLERSLPLVLALGLAETVKDATAKAFEMVRADSSSHALRILSDEDVSVLVLGSQLTPISAAGFLSDCNSRLARVPATLVLCAGSELDLFQSFVDEGRIFYISRQEINAGQLFSLIAAAVNRDAAKKLSQEVFVGNHSASDRVLDMCVRLPMQTDLRSCGGLIVRTLEEVLEVNAAHCMVYELNEDTLTPTDLAGESQLSYSAASGLTAFVARTGEGIRVENVDFDPRYDNDIDDLENRANLRFAAEPILGPDGLPIGVITALRSTDSLPFFAADSRIIKQIAECAAPTFNQILLQTRVQAHLTKRISTADGSSDIFRQEALEYHIRSWDRQGDVLASLPVWLQTSYWVVLVMVLVGIVGLALLIPGLRNIFTKVN